MKTEGACVLVVLAGLGIHPVTWFDDKPQHTSSHPKNYLSFLAAFSASRPIRYIPVSFRSPVVSFLGPLYILYTYDLPGHTAILASSTYPSSATSVLGPGNVIRRLPFFVLILQELNLKESMIILPTK